MTRLFSRIAGATLALTVLAGGAAMAQVDPVCESADIYCQYSYKSTPANPNYLLPLTDALFPKSIFAIGPHSPQAGGEIDPVLGIINLDTFYLILLDGNHDAMDPFDGYLGISGRDLDTALLGLVFSREGNFDRFDSGNEPLIGIGTLRLPAGLGLPAVLSHPGLPIGAPPFGTLPLFRIPALPGPIPMNSPNLVLGGKLF